ncbi:MAG: amidohydrolase family protein [Solirubrobacterales bacterium]
MPAIDCQVHWYPPAFLEWCLDRASFPRCRREGEGFAYELAPEVFFDFQNEMIDLERLFQRMNRASVDVLVISTEPALDVTTWKIDEAKEGVRILNEAKALAQRENPGRLFGLASLPLQDPEAAIAELDHAVGRLGLPGVCVPSNIGGEPIVSPELLPLYKRIEELQVPLFLHPTRSIVADRLPDYGLEYAIGYMFDTSVAALNLVFSGTLDDCPELTVVHPHLGALLPYHAERIDIQYKLPWSGNAGFPGLPSEYIKRFYTDTVSNSPAALRMAVDFYGADRILFATDYPWWEPEPGLDLVKFTLEGAERDLVLHRNAESLLNLRP